MQISIKLNELGWLLGLMSENGGSRFDDGEIEKIVKNLTGLTLTANVLKGCTRYFISVKDDVLTIKSDQKIELEVNNLNLIGGLNDAR